MTFCAQCAVEEHRPVEAVGVDMDGEPACNAHRALIGAAVQTSETKTNGHATAADVATCLHCDKPRHHRGRCTGAQKKQPKPPKPASPELTTAAKFVLELNAQQIDRLLCMLPLEMKVAALTRYLTE